MLHRSFMSYNLFFSYLRKLAKNAFSAAAQALISIAFPSASRAAICFAALACLGSREALAMAQKPPAPMAPAAPLAPTPPPGSSPFWEESDRPDTSAWTRTTMQTILDDGSALFDGARDIAQFCPNYARLSQADRAWAWALIISAIAKYESGFNPTVRYRERTMGRDPITGLPVYSEGLLQLSYQDAQANPDCNEFDWHSDRALPPSDPRRTILDPAKNLRCGVRIMNRQVGRFGAIAFWSSYWATLRPSRGSRLWTIQSMVRSTPLCRKPPGR
jgi:hypothetical protein